MSPPSSGSTNKPDKEPSRALLLRVEELAQHGASCAFTPVAFLAYSSTLKMGVICSSEASIDFQRTTRFEIPEDRKK
jgi:hypothetical protein